MTKSSADGWLRHIVLVGTTLALIGGCSSSSKGVTPGAPTRTQPAPPASGFVDASFRAKIAVTCKSAGNALHAAGSFPFPNFDPQHPVVKDLPAIGHYEAKTVPALQAWRTALHALGQPASGSAAWKTFLADVDQSVTSDIAQEQAALRSNSATFTQTYQDLTSHSPGDAQAAAAIGLPNCNPGNPS
jgi:hypothetical protein